MLKEAKSAPKKIKITELAAILRTLASEEPWDGTITQLVAALESHDVVCSFPRAHLAIWLRRHEPVLYWQHGVTVRFSRTGRSRKVHLARRERSGRW